MLFPVELHLFLCSVVFGLKVLNFNLRKSEKATGDV